MLTPKMLATAAYRTITANMIEEIVNGRDRGIDRTSKLVTSIMSGKYPSIAYKVRADMTRTLAGVEP